MLSVTLQPLTLFIQAAPSLGLLLCNWSTAAKSDGFTVVYLSSSLSSSTAIVWCNVRQMRKWNELLLDQQCRRGRSMMGFLFLVSGAVVSSPGSFTVGAKQQQRVVCPPLLTQPACSTGVQPRGSSGGSRRESPSREEAWPPHSISN